MTPDEHMQQDRETEANERYVQAAIVLERERVDQCLIRKVMMVHCGGMTSRREEIVTTFLYVLFSSGEP
jgi:hypothetical protein